MEQCCFQGWPEAGALNLEPRCRGFLQEATMTVERGLVGTWKGHSARLNIPSPLEIPQFLAHPQAP